MSRTTGQYLPKGKSDNIDVYKSVICMLDNVDEVDIIIEVDIIFRPVACIAVSNA